MRIGVNQFCWPDSFDIADAAQRAESIGFSCFEACLTAGKSVRGYGNGVTDSLDITSYYNRLLNTDSKEEDYRELKKMTDDIGLPISSVGGIVSFSIFSLSSEEASVAQKAEDAVKKMIDAAHIFEADTVLVIPGILTENMRYEYAYERVQARIARLADYADNVTLAVENVWNNFLYSPMELNRFVDETGKQNVGIYFDVANARRFGYPQQWILTMGHRIKKLHIKDYRISVDNINSFTNILDGDVDYPSIMKALKDIGYDGDLIVELIPPAKHMLDFTLRHAKNVLEKLIE